MKFIFASDARDKVNFERKGKREGVYSEQHFLSLFATIIFPLLTIIFQAYKILYLIFTSTYNDITIYLFFLIRKKKAYSLCLRPDEARVSVQSYIGSRMFSLSLKISPVCARHLAKCTKLYARIEISSVSFFFSVSFANNDLPFYYVLLLFIYSPSLHVHEVR